MSVVLNQFKDVYDTRWANSRNTRDEDILALKNPKTQVQFFYHHYNLFIAEQIRRHIGDCRGKKLLELGCGRATSSIFQALYHEGLEVFPSDFSANALRIAEKNAEKYGVKARFIETDLYKTPLGDESFDIVISLGVMEHVEQPEKAYREMRRLLGKNGLMISMNVPEHPQNIQRLAAGANRWLARIESWVKKGNSKPWLDRESRSKTANVHRSTLYGDDFAVIVKNAGFSDVAVYEANPFPTFDPVPLWIDRLIVKTYRSILRIRKFLHPSENPFFCSRKNSRMHFIVARK